MVRELKETEARLIFVRHGQSEGNEKNLFLGHTDLDLTEKGYRQAELVCEHLKKTYDISKIYASDLMRAYHTVEPLAEKINLQINFDQAFREIDAGEWEGHSFSEISSLFPNSFDVWSSSIGLARCEGGESVFELRTRVLEAAERVARENPGRTICIGSHATPIRMLGGFWRSLSIEQAHQVPFPTNASISVAVYRDGRFFECETYSKDDYLGDFQMKIFFDGRSRQ